MSQFKKFLKKVDRTTRGAVATASRASGIGGTLGGDDEDADFAMKKIILGKGALDKKMSKSKAWREHVDRLGLNFDDGFFNAQGKRFKTMSQDIANISGKQNKKDKKKAAEEAAAAQRAVAAEVAPQFDPYVNAGFDALRARQSALGLGGGEFDPSILLNSPAYQFAMDQGIKGGKAAFAGTGLVGREAMELTRFASGLATSTFQDYIANLTNASNQGLQALGQRAQLQSGMQLSAIETELAGTLGGLNDQQQTNQSYAQLIGAAFGM